MMVKRRKKKPVGSHDSRTRPVGQAGQGPHPKGYEVMAMLFVMHSDGEMLSTLDMLANTRSPREQGGDVRKARPGGAPQVRWPLLACSSHRGGTCPPAGPAKAAEAKGGSISTFNRYFWTSTVDSFALETSASVLLIPDRGCFARTVQIVRTTTRHMRVG